MYQDVRYLSVDEAADEISALTDILPGELAIDLRCGSSFQVAGLVYMPIGGEEAMVCRAAD